MTTTLRSLCTALLLLSLFLLFPARAEEKKAKNAPHSVSADMSKPVKVYLLMGQSNMLGFGMVKGADRQGTLENITKQQGKYPNVIRENGKWVVRKDVRYVHMMMGELQRNEWLTVASDNIGPELQIGHILGDYHEEPVLILKACVGNRSLGWDYLPPGSKSFEYRGKVYAGYRQVGSWVIGEQPKLDWKSGAWYAGKTYDRDVASSKRVLDNLGKYYPGAKGYEIAGFFWWQGHKDQNKLNAMRYEQNMVQFIESIRKDFAAPKMPFAIATIGFGGRGMKGVSLQVLKAQLAVDGNKGKYPQFKGNVKSFDTRKFWQPRRRSPGGSGSHYNLNAETYMDVGNGLGEAMLELHQTAKKAKNDE